MAEDLRRFNCDLSATDFEQLDVLMSTLGLRTKRQLFEEAIGILQWAVQERQQGRQVGSLDDRRYAFKELSTPALQRVRKP